MMPALPKASSTTGTPSTWSSTTLPTSQVRPCPCVCAGVRVGETATNTATNAKTKIPAEATRVFFKDEKVPRSGFNP